MGISLQEKIRQELQDRGFEIVHFTRPPLGDAEGRFLKWLQDGFDGEMAYLPRSQEKCLDPSLLLKNCRSVIVTAHPYDSCLPNTADPQSGNISRYAWGEDYHQVLRDKLKSFGAWFQQQDSSLQFFLSVDAAPVLEKAWAQKAGVGWLGKHTNILNEDVGSYFFLSAILTNLPFIPDPEASDRCGNCERCLEVCPTQAIVAPYVLDARLCISYLTIELKGSIPRTLRPLIGNHIFGCDDCQEVCPWNRFSKPTEEGRFYPREGVRNQSLVSFLDLDEAAFKKKFRGSAILRAKRRGFLRNVLVAIGNSGQISFAEAVKEKFSDPDPLVRGHAVWAYGRLLGKVAQVALQELKEREQDPFVLEEIHEIISDSSL